MSSQAAQDSQKALSSMPMVRRACLSRCSRSATTAAITSTNENITAAKVNGDTSVPTCRPQRHCQSVHLYQRYLLNESGE